MRIGVDVMGGDRSPKTLFQAVLELARDSDADHTFVVYATPQVAEDLQQDHQDGWPSESQGKIAFVEAQDVIAMDESPLTAIRKKRDASMTLGVRHLNDGELDAFISTGNTGALIASTTLTLKRLPGVDRPALLASLPTEKGPVAVLDVGGNVSCRPQHIVQFAHLGAAYQACAVQVDCPRVGLLNIGLEAQKGNPHTVRIYQTLKEHCDRLGSRAGMDFVGNVEGRDVYRGKVDVLVTDGFTGNVFLKSSEGVSSFILEHLRDAFASSSHPDAERVLANLQKHVDYAEYPGALLCGVDGVVVKCHGDSCQRALANGIRGTIKLVKNQLIQRLREQLATA